MINALYMKTEITDVPGRPELCRLSWKPNDHRKILYAAKKLALNSTGRTRELAAHIADVVAGGQDYMLASAMDCSELFQNIS